MLKKVPYHEETSDSPESRNFVGIFSEGLKTECS